MSPSAEQCVDTDDDEDQAKLTTISSGQAADMLEQHFEVERATRGRHSPITTAPQKDQISGS